jgi:hypothetical protein
MAARSLPEMIRLNARMPRGQDGYWAIMKKLGARGRTFTVADVEGDTNVPRAHVEEYMNRLVKGGFLVAFSSKPKRFQLCKNPPAEAPRVRPDGSRCPPRKQDQMWRAMRALKTFSAHDLAFAASTPECKVPLRTALRYAAELTRAGYLVRNGVLGSHAGMTFRLKPAMNTGPLSPSIIRADVVFDRNLRRVVGDAVETKEIAS